MADGYVNDPTTGSQSLSYEHIHVLHLLWGMSAEPWCVKDSDGLFVYANGAYLDIFDIPIGTSVLGKSEEVLMLPNQSNAIATIVSGDKYSLSKTILEKINFILKISNKNDEAVNYIYFDKHPIFHANGSVCGFGLHGRREFIFSLNMFSKGRFAVNIKGSSPSELFTERQWEVIYFLQQHYTNSEIANILFVSPKTINNHVAQIYRKTGVNAASDFLDFCDKCDLLHYLPSELQRRILM